MQISAWKQLEKSVPCHCHWPPWPLQVMIFRPASPHLPSSLPPQTCSLSVLSERSCLWELETMGLKTIIHIYIYIYVYIYMCVYIYVYIWYPLVQGEVSIKSMFLFPRILGEHFYSTAWPRTPSLGLREQELQSQAGTQAASANKIPSGRTIFYAEQSCLRPDVSVSWSPPSIWGLGTLTSSSSWTSGTGNYSWL